MRYLAFALALAVTEAHAGSRAWLTAPEADWAQAAPYVHANVVPFIRGDQRWISVCEGVVLESAADPFDPALSDFVKVLLLQRLSRDESFGMALQAVAEGAKARLAASTDLDAFRADFWAALDRSEVVQRTLRADYDKARRKGRLRCRICEKDPRWKPAGLQPAH